MEKPSYADLEKTIHELELKLQEQDTPVISSDIQKKKNPSVLIIDDDDSVRSSLSSYLEDSNYKPFTACDGQQGIDTFTKEDIDLVLVDLRMPQMDGFDVIRHIHKISPNTPLIVVSGASGIQDAIETMKIGAWDYLVKPIKEMSVLIYAIERALNHSNILYEKQKAEQLLVKSEKIYSRLIETTSSGFWRVDKDQLTVEVNQAFCDMLGYTHEEMISKPASYFVNQKEKEIITKTLTDPEKSTSKQFGIILKTKQGDELHALFDTALIFDDNNKVSGAFAFVSNITEKIKNHQLKIAIETAGAICHELHQPMQTILGYVEVMLIEMSEQDKNFEFITIIKESIDRMNRITSKLSNITKYKTKKHVDKTIVDLEKSFFPDKK